MYFILFYLIWTIRELWLVDFINTMDPTVASIVGAVIKLLVWVAPIIILVKLVEKKEPLKFLGLRENLSKGFGWATWVSFALVIFFIMANLLFSQTEINLNLGLHTWLNTVILVGITEEIVFRGFILRKLMQQFTFWKANSITALLFLTIHFPIWFHHELFERPGILFTFIQVFIIGFIFGLIYRKSNSLWSVIIIHSVYNLGVSIFI
ncbi:CPBP family intramembrane glutamic endopeptidase [Paucisalibacillus globulus]|uniref:CPBP family intramembrane glutamic endopeptidase n=1 Tax=Paucisalibacillus globulus TaxID=351095 RepID=UPI001C3E914A|nr:CPBP family intramembrane glutamic endopeptidase [Paucisalibacillus globulus]